MSDLRAITVEARVDATVKGTLYVTDEQVRQALEMAPDLPVTDDDLILYASEHDDLADVELIVHDVNDWRSSTFTVVQPA